MEGCELTVARWLRTRAADRSALAQSDEVPDPLALEIAKEIREKPEFKEMVAQAHALAQSDAGPWRCPIGIAPESHGICSAGTCWWCLADRVKAQSDAGPREQQSEIIHLTSALREAESRIEALSDASGLIEAAKMAERNADRDGGTGPNALRHLAKVLRARAADRSGK